MPQAKLKQNDLPEIASPTGGAVVASEGRKATPTHSAMTAAELADMGDLAAPEVHQWQAKIADYVEDQSWERPLNPGLERWANSKSILLVLGASAGLWAVLWASAWVLL